MMAGHGKRLNSREGEKMSATAPRWHGKTGPRKDHVPQLPVRVVGGSYYLPEQVVTNHDLAARGFDHDWIVQRTGIHQRHLAAADQSTSDLATQAGRDCLQSVGLAPDDVDLIVVATCTPDHIAPSVACLVQDRLGCHRAAAFDVNAACSGFMYAYLTACQYVASGCYENVLVIGADVLSRVIDPNDIKTFPLFGDGASALLLQPSSRSVISADGHRSRVARGGDAGVMGFELGAEGRLGQSLIFPAGGSRQPLTHQALDSGLQYLHMDGRTVFKWAVQLIPQVVQPLLQRCQVSIEEVTLFALHQANTRIIDAAMESLQIPKDKVWSNVGRYGNTCSASVPLVLVEAERAGRLQRGDYVVMCGFGAGLTWGTALVRW